MLNMFYLLWFIFAFCNFFPANSINKELLSFFNSPDNQHGNYRILSVETKEIQDPHSIALDIYINRLKENKDIRLNFRYYIIYRDSCCKLSPFYGIFEKEEVAGEILNLDIDKTYIKNPDISLVPFFARLLDRLEIVGKYKVVRL
jgi:hypothetical protein